MKIAKSIRVIGIVQGVGFRPFVARIAKKFDLKGYVRNIGGSEVEIYVVGEEENIQRFLDALKKEKPPTAELEEIIVRDEKIQNFQEFEIKKSSRTLKEPSMIPPDVGICEECIREIENPNTRWYYYPFNSCAWCGPRFSVMFKVPYDRENTSMREFPLCEHCLAEYNDESNLRRYHIQGISCSICGPRIWLTNNRGEVLTRGYKDTILETAKLLEEGFIVAIKGLGGFHIAALATSDDTVETLRQRKKRPQKPFALMAMDVETVEKHAYVSEKERLIIESKEKPIVLLKKREESDISELVAPGLKHIGFMLPYTGLHYLLLRNTVDKLLIMTSGNPPGRPMCIDNKCALSKLNGIVDYFLLHDRKIVNRVDDSVLRVSNNRIAFLRRSRGYAPKWLRAPFDVGNRVYVGFGADLQNAGAVLFQDKVLPTQYIGDIDDIENVRYLSEAIKFFMDTYGLWNREITLVVDKHPNYQSRKIAIKWLEEMDAEIVEVQHHHSHIVSTMLEKKMDAGEDVVGISIDGAGYGADGNIWGGEVLIANYQSFEKVGGLEYNPMPGGDSATFYPVKMLIGFLSNFMNKNEVLEFLENENLLTGLKHGYKEAELSYILAKSKRTPMTSSLGRVLDAFSALLKICMYRSYEGEPAMKFEALALSAKKPVIFKDLTYESNGGIYIKTSELFEKTIFYKNDIKPNDLALGIHITLARSLADIAVSTAKDENIKTIILSGGAAVNEIILREIEKIVKSHGLSFMYPEKLPPGDGGIAVGQVSIAALVDRS